MAFSFGFSGDDIDIDEFEGNNEVPDLSSLREKDSSLPELVKASQHDMNDWVHIPPTSHLRLSFPTRSRV
jgi:protein-histidine N-methyltransferase